MGELRSSSDHHDTHQSPVVLPLRVVVAVQAEDGGIGLAGKLPWPHIAEDLRHFRRVTTTTPPTGYATSAGVGPRAAVLMGRRTWESLPVDRRPLRDRVNIVLTRGATDGSAYNSGVLVAGSVEAALELARAHGVLVVYVIGGVTVFREAMQHPACDRLYVTRIRHTGSVAVPYACDTYMPPIDTAAFVPVVHSGVVPAVARSADGEEAVSLEFVEYQRRDDRFRSETPASNGSNDPSVSPPDNLLMMTTGNPEERQYLDLVRRVLAQGVLKADRTGVGTLSLFGATMRFCLRDQRFPLLTTKRVFWRGVVEELLWMVRGSTDARSLSSKGVHIWDGNGSRAFLDSLGLTGRREGDLGPVYGFQWRHFGARYVDCETDYAGQGVDQLQRIVETLRRNPNDRRMVMCAWNPSDLPAMALPPCHVLVQFYVASGRLSCAMYQRSCDLGLGVPFNIASYALLTVLIAHVTGLQPDELVHILGDAHVYCNHVEALQEQLKREPRPFPTLRIRRPVAELDDFQFDDLELIGYAPHAAVKMEMAV